MSTPTPADPPSVTPRTDEPSSAQAAAIEGIVFPGGTFTHCIVCGGPLDPGWSSGGCHSYNRGFKPDVHDCFSFHFWSQKFAWRVRGDLASVDTPYDGSHIPRAESPRQYAVRIDGHHYCVVNTLVDRRNAGFLGFGGAVQYATITDGPNAGVVINANNWWSQGPIPPEWRTMLPDNARFITKEEYDSLIQVHKELDVDPAKSINDYNAPQ